MFPLLSCYNLFLREVSKKKLERLASLAHKDPNPLFTAIKYGFFNGIKKAAVDFLKTEKEKAKFDKVKQDFQMAIDMLSDEK